MNNMTNTKACMTGAVACFMCCVFSVASGFIQSVLQKTKCDKQKKPDGSDELKCPDSITIISGLLGSIACICCLFASMKLLNPRFMC